MRCAAFACTRSRLPLHSIDRVHIGRRMEFDTDIIVRLFWAGTPVVNLPTPGDLSGGRRFALSDAARQPAHYSGCTFDYLQEC